MQDPESDHNLYLEHTIIFLSCTQAIQLLTLRVRARKNVKILKNNAVDGVILFQESVNKSQASSAPMSSFQICPHNYVNNLALATEH